MNKVPQERRHFATLGGATAVLSSSSLVLFHQLPHTALYEALQGLAIGLPIGVTLILFYRMKRRRKPSRVVNEA